MTGRVDVGVGDCDDFPGPNFLTIAPDRSIEIPVGGSRCGLWSGFSLATVI